MCAFDKDPWCSVCGFCNKSYKLDSTAVVGSNYCCVMKKKVVKGRGGEQKTRPSSHLQVLNLSEVSIVVRAWKGAKWQNKNVVCKVSPRPWWNELPRDINSWTNATGVTKSQWPECMYTELLMDSFVYSGAININTHWWNEKQTATLLIYNRV